MLAIIRCRIFCFPVCYPNAYVFFPVFPSLLSFQLSFHNVLCMAVPTKDLTDKQEATKQNWVNDEHFAVATRCHRNVTHSIPSDMLSSPLFFQLRGCTLYVFWYSGPSYVVTELHVLSCRHHGRRAT
jgi:hypothetical protein